MFRGLQSIPAVLAFTLAASAAPAQTPAVGPGAKPWAVPRTPDGQPDLRGMWVNFDSTPFETAGTAPAAPVRRSAGHRRQPAVALGRSRQPDAGRAARDGRRSARRQGAGDEMGGRQARVRPRTRRRQLGAPDAVGAVHHARHPGGHVSGRLQQRLPVHADAGLRRDRVRNDPRDAVHSARRTAAPRCEHPIVGRRRRAGTGKARRSSWTRPTTTTRDRSPRARPRDASAGFRRAKRCTSSSASRRSMRTRSCTASPWTTRTSTRSPGPSRCRSRAIRSTRCSSMRARRATTRRRTSWPAGGLRTRK